MCFIFLFYASKNFSSAVRQVTSYSGQMDWLWSKEIRIDSMMLNVYWLFSTFSSTWSSLTIESASNIKNLRAENDVVSCRFQIYNSNIDILMILMCVFVVPRPMRGQQVMTMRQSIAINLPKIGVCSISYKNYSFLKGFYSCCRQINRIPPSILIQNTIVLVYSRA